MEKESPLTFGYFIKKNQCPYCQGKGKILDFIGTLKKWKGRILANDDLNVFKSCKYCKGTGKWETIQETIQKTIKKHS